MKNLLQQAVIYHQDKNYIEAKKLYKYILKMDPKCFDVLMLLGFLYAELGEVDDAINFLLKAVKINDESEHVCFNLAVAFASKGQLQNAERFFRRALIINPENLKSLQELAAIESRKNCLDSAAGYYERAIKLAPLSGDVYNDLALIKKRQKKYSEAIALFNKAIELNPSDTNALANLGNLYIEMGDFSKAQGRLYDAIGHNPNLVGAYIGLGNIAEKRDMYLEAIDLYDKSLSLDGGSIVALTNKAQILLKLGRYQDALAIFKEAWLLDPGFKNLCGSIIWTQLQLCEWTSLAKQIDVLQKRIGDGLSAAEPFIELTVSDSLRLQKKAAEIYFGDQFRAVGEESLENAPVGKIKVAYLSADFRSHPIAFLAAELFELHSREKFEFIGISFSKIRDDWQLRISNAFDEFIDASEMSDSDILNLVRQSKIDIAIDLGGYTQNSRFSLFARRLSPVQMSYLGYLGTTGSKCIDYIIADREIIPSESQNFYSEKIAYLPSYQANDSHRVASDTIFSRQALGIPEDAFVYCCFNNNYKILPEMFTCWMKILVRVEKSILFLYADSDIVRENLKKEALSRGVDSSRLVFGGRLSTEDYLARYQVVDLFLDTFPYNAGATANDALWMGVPVLTRQGESFASRVASSLLRAIGLPELITRSLSEYESMACKLGQDRVLLDSMKTKLDCNKLTTPLFNTHQVALNLEKLYEIAYQRSIAGLRPENIVID